MELRESSPTGSSSRTLMTLQRIRHSGRTLPASRRRSAMLDPFLCQVHTALPHRPTYVSASGAAAGLPGRATLSPCALYGEALLRNGRFICLPRLLLNPQCRSLALCGDCDAFVNLSAPAAATETYSTTKLSAALSLALRDLNCACRCFLCVVLVLLLVKPSIRFLLGVVR